MAEYQTAYTRPSPPPARSARSWKSTSAVAGAAPRTSAAFTLAVTSTSRWLGGHSVSGVTDAVIVDGRVSSRVITTWSVPVAPE